MSTAGKKKEGQSENEQEALKAYQKAYIALCKKHGYQVVTTPIWQNRDDGTWSMVLQTGIGRIKQD